MANKTLLTRIVLRNDTSTAWTEANPTLLLGEAGYETDTHRLKFGDGTTAWNDLPYFGEEAESVAKVYQIEVAAGASHTDAISEEVGEGELHNGDIAIVKELIAGDKRQYTAYVYDGTNWVAMDGNYSAENVYLKDNITLAGNYTQVGNLTKSQNGTATFSVAGKSVAEALLEIFSKRLQPTKVDPSVSITLKDAGAKEVGTEITPNYTVTFNKGSYTYGPDTGVTVADYVVTDTLSHTASTATGAFDTFTVAEDTNYKVNVTVNYDEGAVANDNLGSASSPEIKIEAGSKSASSSSITGYRGWFCGYYNGSQALVDATAITSAQIRAFGVRNGNFVTSMPTTQMKQMFFAAPQGLVTSVDVANAVNGAPQTVKKTTVNVEGANDYTAVPYDVFYVANATAEGGASTFTITTAKA